MKHGPCLATTACNHHDKQNNLWTSRIPNLQKVWVGLWRHGIAGRLYVCVLTNINQHHSSKLVQHGTPHLQYVWVGLRRHTIAGACTSVC
jgi:hypothetical protein